MELLALWALLYFTVAIGIPTLHVFGDSFVVINWENDKAALSALDLVYWCDNITVLKSSFLSLEFQYVYNEHNKRADCLSKEALSMASGLLSFIEFYEGCVIGGGGIHLF